MKKKRLKPITLEEFENLSKKRKRTSIAAEITEEFIKSDLPVMEVSDIGYKSPFICAAAIREYCRRKELNITASQRKNRVFILKTD